MKPREVDAEVEYSDDAEIIVMEIDEEGLPALFGMLSGMYNDPALAVIREYTTNAIDANIESGTDKPVDVYLPSELGEATFIVQDYGPGMSKQEVRDTYSKYVKSTKRNSNDFAGMFGIGSKSALAYTNQFTVESIQDGVRTVMTFSKARSAPEIDVRQFKSDRPNGTIVKIPVSDMNSFNYKAREHFKLLEAGLVRVDGKDIGGEYRDTKISKGVYVSNDLDEPCVIMGNVPYSLPDDLGYNVDRYGYRRSNRKTRGNFLFEVPLGKFMPAPPREGLELNDDDIKELKRMIQAADDNYIKLLRENIKKAKSVFEAVKVRDEYSNVVVDNGSIPDVVIDGITIDGWKLKVPKMVWDSEKTTESTYIQSKNTIRTTMFARKRISMFYNATDDISDYYRKKITDWCQTNNKPTNFAGFKKKSDIPSGYPDELVFDFAEVQDWSRPSRSGKGNTTSSGMWQEVVKLPHSEAWEKSRTPFNWRTTNKIKEDSHGKKDLVYVSPSDHDSGVTFGMLQMAIQDDDTVLIALGKNRWDKLNRNYTASHIKDWYKKNKDKLIQGLTEDHFRRPPRKLPDLDTDLHRRYNERVEELSEMRTEAVNKLGSKQVNIMSTGSDPEIEKLREQIEERYPYAPTSIYRNQQREMANVYVNAMDLYYKEKKND